MNAGIRRKLERGFRVLSFSQVHPDESAGYGSALTHLEEGIALGDALATQQRAGVIEEGAATARKQDIRVMMERSLLRHVARVADGASKEQPELRRKFRMPKDDGTFQAFRTAARAMADEAVTQKDLLIVHGLSEPLLNSLQKALDEFDSAVLQAAAGKRAHVGAGAQLAAVVRDIDQVVRVMDALNRFRFADDAEKLAAWESARNLATPTHTHAGEPAPVGEKAA